MQLSSPQRNSTAFNTPQRWLSKTTFWQFNLAVGLPTLFLFIFHGFASHGLQYKFQVWLGNLATNLGFNGDFEPLVLFILFFCAVLFLLLRYSALAAKLKINRLTMGLLLLGNTGFFGLATYLFVHRTFHEPSYTEFGQSMNDVVRYLVRISFGLAVVSLITTLIWHYVINPFPKVKALLQGLLNKPLSNVSQTNTSKISKGIAIAFMIGIVLIALDYARDEYRKLITERNTAFEHDPGLPHFNFATWREAIPLTEPALDAEKNQDWALAAKEWSTLHDTYPKDFDVLQHRAHAYMQLGQYANALQDGVEMTRLSKNNPQGWQTLCSNALLAKKAAANVCQQAAILSPWEAANPLHFAHALLLQGEDEIAAHWYQTAIVQISTQEKLHTLLDDFEPLKKQGINDSAFSQAQADFAKEGEAWLAKLAPANQLLALAEAAEEADDNDKAVQLYLQHIEALTTIAGETNGQTLLAKQRLALLLVTLNRTDEALKHFEDLQRSVEHALGQDHIKMVDVLNGYAFAYAKANKQEASNKMAKKALLLSQDLYGIGSPQTAPALNGIGSSERKLGNMSAAETALSQSVNVSLSQLLPDYQVVAKRMNNYGLYCYAVGGLSTAKYYFTNALQMTELAVGKNHPDNFWRVHNLFKVSMARQDLEGANKWLTRVQEIANMQSSSTHDDMKKMAEEDAMLYIQSLSQPAKQPEVLIN